MLLRHTAYGGRSAWRQVRRYGVASVRGLRDDLPQLPPFDYEDLIVDEDGNPLPRAQKRANVIRRRVAIYETEVELRSPWLIGPSHIVSGDHQPSLVLIQGGLSTDRVGKDDHHRGGLSLERNTSTHGWNDHKVSNPFREVLSELTPFVWKCLYYWQVNELRDAHGITRDDLWSVGSEALWHAQGSWKRQGSFLTYARRCIRNAVVDLIRERDRHREQPLDKSRDEGQEVDDLTPVGSPSFDSPEPWLDYRAALDLIELLPKHHQAVLIGQIVGVSDQELADQGFGTSAEAMKQTRKRARATLAALRTADTLRARPFA